MTDLELFQKEHGQAWNSIIQTSAFSAAMLYLNVTKINAVAALTDEEIETRGKLVLADLRGHLNHENDLLRLPVMKEFSFGAPLEPTYPDPVAELAEQQAAEERPPVTEAPPEKPRKKRK